MQISTILDHIDSGYMALPQFQRGYVWNRDQVRGLFGALYRRHPVGGLLVWVTDSDTADYRGTGNLAPGVVKLRLMGNSESPQFTAWCGANPRNFLMERRRVLPVSIFILNRSPLSFTSSKGWREMRCGLTLPNS